MSSASQESEADSQTLSMAVIATIAEHEGKDPLEIDPPLYDVIDLEALDTFISRLGDIGGATTGRVVFSYNGYEIEVTSDQDVRIIESDE